MFIHSALTLPLTHSTVTRDFLEEHNELLFRPLTQPLFVIAPYIYDDESNFCILRRVSPSKKGKLKDVLELDLCCVLKVKLQSCFQTGKCKKRTNN